MNTLLIASLAILAAEPVASVRALRGQVVSIEDGGEQPLKNVIVTISQCGNTGITDDNGRFTIYLPRNSLLPGQQVEFVTDNQNRYRFVSEQENFQLVPANLNASIRLRMTPVYKVRPKVPIPVLPQGVQVFAQPTPEVEPLDGTWINTGDPIPKMEGRFKLEIVKDSCQWTEFRDTGRIVKLETTVRVAHAGDQIRIERPNDGKVLAFLFRPAVAGQLEKRNPPPSFLQLRQEGNRLVGTWNGLQAKTFGTDVVKEINLLATECQFVKSSTR
jgi:hypothetical protein